MQVLTCILKNKIKQFNNEFKRLNNFKIVNWISTIKNHEISHEHMLKKRPVKFYRPKKRKCVKAALPLRFSVLFIEPS